MEREIIKLNKEQFSDLHQHQIDGIVEINGENKIFKLILTVEVESTRNWYNKYRSIFLNNDKFYESFYFIEYSENPKWDNSIHQNCELRQVFPKKIISVIFE